MSRPPRLKVFSYLGRHCYALTICTAQRRPLFRHSELVNIVLSQMHHVARVQRFAILAYCFMPDHLHLVVSGLASSADLRRFATLFKQRAGYAVAKHYGGRLWQEGYHDRVLRHEESLMEVVRYVLENPVRADLVRTVEEYPFSGCDLMQIAKVI